MLGVDFSVNFGVDKVCFPPTVYEMIKRFEFVKQRYELIETKDKRKNEDFFLKTIKEDSSQSEEEDAPIEQQDFQFTEAELRQSDELSMPMMQHKDTIFIFKNMDLVRHGEKQHAILKTKKGDDKGSKKKLHANSEDETTGILVNKLTRNIKQSGPVDSLLQRHY